MYLGSPTNSSQQTFSIAYFGPDRSKRLLWWAKTPF